MLLNSGLPREDGKSTASGRGRDEQGRCRSAAVSPGIKFVGKCGKMWQDAAKCMVFVTTCAHLNKILQNVWHV